MCDFTVGHITLYIYCSQLRGPAKLGVIPGELLSAFQRFLRRNMGKRQVLSVSRVLSRFLTLEPLMEDRKLCLLPEHQ